MTIQNLHALNRSPRRQHTAESNIASSEWEDKIAEILGELEKPELLYLGLLFHDVGKGMPAANHIEGSLQALEGIMARLQLEAPDAATVRFLIANHLAMSATLQRRDIFEPETVRDFAEIVDAPERLKLLCLLTYADIKSVDIDAMTPWKAELLWRLYAATANHLARSVDEERLIPTANGASEAERVFPRLAPPATREELAAFLQGFPRRYLATHSPQEIAQHFELTSRLHTEGAQLNLRTTAGLNELTVIAEDRPFLFASITGSLAAWGMSIVKADAFANSAGVALDSFRFVDLHRTLELNPSEARRFQANLLEALNKKAEIDKLVRGRLRQGSARQPRVPIPTQIHFDDSSSSHSTILELITQDRPGLLFQVSSVLASLGCNIEIALIDTEGEKVIDVFYLTSAGSKLPPQLQSSVEKALRTELVK